MIGSAGLRWYRTGTVNVTQGSATVTGVGSQWLIAGIKPGDVFSLDSSMWYEVVSVESNTSLTLDMAFQGASGNAQNYKIIRNFAATMQAEIAARVANLVNKYESFIDSELQKLVGPKGDPGIMYKGAWAAGRSYQALDTVTHTDKVYLSRMPHTSTSNNAPGAAGSAWMEFALTAPPILNTLDSDRTDAALSAAQGKALNSRKVSLSGAYNLYVDAEAGDDDTGNGAFSTPYKTLSKVAEVINSKHDVVIGDINILLRPGVHNLTAPLKINNSVTCGVFGIKAADVDNPPVIQFNSTGNDSAFFINQLLCHLFMHKIKIKNIGTKGNSSTGVLINALPFSFNVDSCSFEGFAVGMRLSRLAGLAQASVFKDCTIAIQCVETTGVNLRGNQTESDVNFGIDCIAGIAFDNSPALTGSVSKKKTSLNGQIFG